MGTFKKNRITCTNVKFTEGKNYTLSLLKLSLFLENTYWSILVGTGRRPLYKERLLPNGSRKKKTECVGLGETAHTWWSIFRLLLVPLSRYFFPTYFTVHWFSLYLCVKFLKSVIVFSISILLYVLILSWNCWSCHLNS